MKPSDISARIGINLRNIRKLRGLSVRELSEIIGLTEDAIRKYERGDRSLTVEDMVTFSGKLSCDPQNFMIGLFQPETENSDEIDRLTVYEHGVFVKMSTEFREGKKALIVADDIYMRLSTKRRREIIMTMVVQMDEAIRNHEMSVEDIPEEVGYMLDMLGSLYNL